MHFFLTALICTFFPLLDALAQEAESIEVKGNACEKSIEDESPSSTRVRAVDKAVFLSIKNLKLLDIDKQNMNDHDLNVMIYRLVDDYVEDLSSKVIKSEEGKVCVETKGYLNPLNIEKVRHEFKSEQNGADRQNDEQLVVQIAEDIKKEITLNPKDAENLALVYIDDLVYYNGATSQKYAQFLADEIEENPYYYITKQKDLADYIITPKVLKAKIDTLDEAHKRLHLVLSLEISGLEEDLVSVPQNRFVLFLKQEDEQNIAARLVKKLLSQAGKEAVRQIEKREQSKLEQNALGRHLSD